MRILTLLTYYAPHISGLSVYARRIVSGLTARGHSVTLVTSRYDPGLPAEERIDGVRVLRSRVWFRLNKGVFMPGYIVRACRELHHHDVLYLHLPQIEAAPIALYARLLARKPIVTTYHCDLELPRGFTRWLFTPLIKLSHFVTFLLSHRVVANTEDYVRGSRFLRHFAHRIEISYPPCVPPESDTATALPFAIDPRTPLIGFVGRFAEEKGIQYLIEAAPLVLQRVPDAVFAFVGERERVFGERVFERLRHRIEALGDHVRLLGVVTDAELARFYRRVNVLALPSTNSTESFGMVQVEAMLCGAPVVATDIPGVREAVRATGMGKLVPPRDARALAEGIVDVLEHRDHFAHARTPPELDAIFGLERAVQYYEALLESVASRRLAEREAPVVTIE